jgi:hypothetical protein
MQVPDHLSLVYEGFWETLRGLHSGSAKTPAIQGAISHSAQGSPSIGYPDYDVKQWDAKAAAFNDSRIRKCSISFFSSPRSGSSSYLFRENHE